MKNYLPAFLCLSMTLACKTKEGKRPDLQAVQTTSQPPPTPTENLGVPFPSKIYATSADLPPCDSKISGALAYLTATKTFYNCDAKAWVATDMGNKSSNSGTGLGVFDANGDKVGTLIGPNVNGNGFVGYDLFLLDGRQVTFPNKPSMHRLFIEGRLPLFFEGGEPLFIRGCNYTSNDCSGMCYINLNETNLAYDYAGNLRIGNGVTKTILPGSVSTSRMPSLTSEESPECKNWQNSDPRLGRPGPGDFQETKPYEPTQFKYPFALPLSVR